ncbi:hypothetical protein INF29_12470 [Anaerotignum lactatifermentans]|nr:hypothetical protein [Anaerotignum lactatifermentans]
MHDALFDRYLITFDENRHIVISQILTKEQR